MKALYLVSYKYPDMLVARVRTFQLESLHRVVQPIGGRKEDFDVENELFGYQDTVDVGTITDMQQHIRDTCGR